jgi:hypothetical protein
MCLQGLPECAQLYEGVIKFRKNAMEARKEVDQDDEQIPTVETGAETRSVGAFDNFPKPAPEEEAGTLARLEPVEVGPGQLAESETHLGNSDRPSADDEGFPI